jgi:hypothetical protein
MDPLMATMIECRLLSTPQPVVMDPLMATMIECRLLSTPQPEDFTSLSVPHSRQFDHREVLLSTPNGPVDINQDLLELTTGTFSRDIHCKPFCICIIASGYWAQKHHPYIF